MPGCIFFWNIWQNWNNQNRIKLRESPIKFLDEWVLKYKAVSEFQVICQSTKARSIFFLFKYCRSLIVQILNPTFGICARNVVTMCVMLMTINFSGLINDAAFYNFGVVLSPPFLDGYVTKKGDYVTFELNWIYL